MRDSAGYAPIRDYAAIGDGRTIALVALDGSIDWMPLPDLDSASLFGAILDVDRGGRFTLAPEAPFTATRRYVPDTNVLETTFSTDGGAVRLTDALLFHEPGLAPARELVRHVEGISGSTPLRWSVEPRFGYAAARTTIADRGGVAVASAGRDAVGIRWFDAGRPEVTRDRMSGRCEVGAGETATIVLGAARDEPLVFPGRDDVLRRLDATRRGWQRWAEARSYEGPFHDAVLRSALALKLLVFAPSAAIAGAGTTSLPEEIGGVRNWDYRFSWIRDSSFTLDALLTLGYPIEAEAYFWWLMNASQRTAPRLQVLYRLDGGSQARERTLGLRGYRDSRPVRDGNAAAEQLQLDMYGTLLESAALYTATGHQLDGEVARRFTRIADLVSELWRTPDSGIWEVRSEPRHFTQSKMMCWVALDRAITLAETSQVPADRLARWRGERDAIRDYVEERCWSEDRNAYVRAAGASDLDASVLHASLLGYVDPTGPRMLGTLDAIDRELRDGPFVRRYSGEDGLPGREGAFLTCSFWYAEAQARAGRVDHAHEMVEELVSLANDVGLYAEEIDPADGAFLGNFPQALPHLALVGAASAVAQADRGAP
jgi:GH15 family glucan-1,4-alpha-glucosidase